MDRTRRDTLKQLGTAALAVGVVPVLGSCSGPVRSSSAASDARVPGLDPVVADVLLHASLAPSGHNTQPWVVSVPEPHRLRIGTARERWLPAVDPENRELLLSLGCFLENLVGAARHRGLDVAYEVVAATPTEMDVLDVTLRPATPAAFPLERIRLRRTVRGGHLPQELRGADVQALSVDFGDRLAYFPSTSSHARWLADATIEANVVQARRDPAQEELSRWIRFADDEALRQRNGLTPESMEITGLAGWYVRHFMDRASVMTPSFRERGVDAVRRHVKAYGGWLVITSADASVATLIETGRLFERMWLGCRERMIALHPMTQILEEAPFRDQAARQLGVDGRVQFLVRASYLARYPDPVSLRMPAARFVAGTSEPSTVAGSQGAR